MTSIAAQSFTLEELFGGSRLFRIPYYQRPYAWDEEQADALLNDFLRSMGPPERALATVDPYFLGTMVVSQDGSPYAQVVDGQQRLTTLTILFVIMRALLPQGYADRLDERIFQKSGFLVGSKRERRLELRDADDSRFFASTFQDAKDLEPLNRVDIEEKSDSQARITRVARYFLSDLTVRSPEERLRLKEFILSHCVVILVSAHSKQGGDTAFTIFTVLNKPGVDLSTGDILKAEILGRIQQEGRVSHQEMEKYAAPWEDLEQRLGREGMVDLINYTRTIFRPGAPQSTIIAEFRKYVIQTRSGLDLDKVVTEILTPLGDALATIREERYYRTGVPTETISQLNELFGWFNSMGNSDWLPPAIYYLSKHHQDAERLLLFFKRLERLAVYLMLTRADANARSVRYREVLEDIKAGKVLDDSSRLQLDESSQNNEVAFLRKKLGQDVYTLPGATRQYLLLRLDGQFPEGKVTYTVSPTIEHVLPQNPSQSWLTQWGGCWADAKTRKRYTNSLANLVLLSGPVNVAAANKSFADKKRIYFPKATPKTKRTPFQITGEMLQAHDWSLATVEARQKRLLGILYDLWDLDPVTS